RSHECRGRSLCHFYTRFPQTFPFPFPPDQQQGPDMSSNVFIGAKEYFPGIGRIKFEGRDSDNPLAFKVFDADKKIGGKTMAEHLRFATCYWHTFGNAGADPFGPGTRKFPWEAGTPMATAEA